jgi:hypothetical protein
MSSSYDRKCRYCGCLIKMRETSTGRWAAFDDFNKKHNCKNAPNRKQPADRSSIEDAFNDVSFPEEFVLKNEAERKHRRSSSRADFQSGKRRVIKRQSSRQASHPKARHGARRLSGGSLLFLMFVFLVVLFLLSRIS